MPGGPSTSRKGALAEDAALTFLEQQGLRLMQRNYRCRWGEIDLVMREAATLVIVEVRYRTSSALLEPGLSVDARKRRRLLQAARRFLQEHPHEARRSVRFDVVSLSGPLDAPRCRWFRGAFDADDHPA
ncbi:MAG: YraN family protein [Gammaproteobacteria bacterium]|nr:YraN family protein [Gammaproteobacteria bacterium]